MAAEPRYKDPGYVEIRTASRAVIAINPADPTWREIRRRIEYSLTDLRASLETPGLSAVETESIRGGIRCLKGLIDSVENVAIAPAPTDDPHNLLGGTY